MKVSAADCQDLDRALSLEWLEANGRGGFASGTVAGANTRRYHALLLIARRPPVDRVVLVNHLEESLEIQGQLQGLSTNLYPGAVHPQGYRLCTGFSTEPWPTWTYEVGGLRLLREIFCPQGRDLVLLRWTLLGGAADPIRLTVRPMLSGRDHHGIHRENSVLNPESHIKKGTVTWQPYAGLPAVRALHNGSFQTAPDWYRRVQYPIEQDRGMNFEEDWWTPGELAFRLTPQQPALLGLTTEAMSQAEMEEVIASEQRRRMRSRRREDAPKAPTTDPLVHALWQASETFIADRGKQKTVIAGYPWFTDWGRDTFISLPGLCLVTGRYAMARQIIAAFAASISEGMIPNRFPDEGEQPEYNTIDASLWFVHAVGRYLAYTGDAAGVKRVAWPAVRAVLDGYRQGTRYGIRLDHDGLVTGGAPGVQLTWMDAKIGDWVVTPRRGKPVEIQALWVNALTVGEELALRFRDKAYAERCAEDRARAVESFRKRFWQGGGALYDVVDAGMGQADDASFRANQIYAVALDGRLLDEEQARRVVDAVEAQLLTPVGLRTLAPGDPHYHPRYEGGVVTRDVAYHQGTVWPHLLGPFITAWIKVRGGAPEARQAARRFLDGIERHLQEACLGQVSEIFDGDPPHRPCGCFAQAWSLAEPLRALLEDVYGLGPAAAPPPAADRRAAPRKSADRRKADRR